MTGDSPLDRLERTLRWMERVEGKVRGALAALALAGAYMAGYVLRARGWVDSLIAVFFFFGALFCLYEPYFVGGVIDRCVRAYRDGKLTDLRARGNWLLRAAFRTGKYGLLNVALLTLGAGFAASVAVRFFLAHRTGEAVANVLIVLANAGVAATVLLCRQFHRFYGPVQEMGQGHATAERS